MRSPDPRLLSLELAALLIAAAFAMIFAARLPTELPTEDDHRAAGEAIAKLSQPGDVLLLHPWWTERARLFAPDGLPVVGYLGSDDEPLTDHPRILLLDQPNLPRAGSASFLERFKQARSQLGQTQAFGNLELSVWRNDRFRPRVFSAAEAIDQAHVYLEDPSGGRQECPWNGHAHQCPAGGHLRAAREWHEVDQIPRHCLYMHPPGGAARMVAEWQSVPPAERVYLEGGIIWEHSAMKQPDVSDVTVRADDGEGHSLVSFVARMGEERLYRESAASPAQPFALRLSVQADRANARDSCIDFLVRGPAADKGAP